MYTLGHDGEIVSLRKQLDWNISWWVSDPKKLKITCQDDGSVQFGGVTRKTCIRSLCLGKKDVPDFPAGDILMLAY